MAIIGARMLLYTPEAEALRTVLRDVLGWKYVESNDPPDGWRIFKLPPSELGVHPSEGATTHQICLMCDDSTRSLTRSAGVSFGRGWCQARDVSPFAELPA